jgi:hypothetical protein
MAKDPTDNLPSSDELDFDNEEYSNELSNEIAEFELNSESSEKKSSKQNNQRNFLAKQKIEQLQEKRRLKRFEDDYYGDWD